MPGACGTTQCHTNTTRRRMSPHCSHTNSTRHGQWHVDNMVRQSCGRSALLGQHTGARPRRRSARWRASHGRRMTQKTTCSTTHPLKHPTHGTKQLLLSPAFWRIWSASEGISGDRVTARACVMVSRSCRAALYYACVTVTVHGSNGHAIVIHNELYKVVLRCHAPWQAGSPAPAPRHTASTGSTIPSSTSACR